MCSEDNSHPNTVEQLHRAPGAMLDHVWVLLKVTHQLPITLGQILSTCPDLCLICDSATALASGSFCCYLPHHTLLCCLLSGTDSGCPAPASVSVIPVKGFPRALYAWLFLSDSL